MGTRNQKTQRYLEQPDLSGCVWKQAQKFFPVQFSPKILDK